MGFNSGFKGLIYQL